METSRIINETLKGNKFAGRYAGVGTDFKITFDTIEELKEGIDAIVEAKNYLEQKLNPPIVEEEKKQDEEKVMIEGVE